MPDCSLCLLGNFGLDVISGLGLPCMYLADDGPEIWLVRRWYALRYTIFLEKHLYLVGS